MNSQPRCTDSSEQAENKSLDVCTIGDSHVRYQELRLQPREVLLERIASLEANVEEKDKRLRDLESDRTRNIGTKVSSRKQSKEHGSSLPSDPMDLQSSSQAETTSAMNTDTAPNRAGPGRALGNLYWRAGRVLERWAASIIHDPGSRPYATSE